jgi:hypothetical protein
MRRPGTVGEKVVREVGEFVPIHEGHRFVIGVELPPSLEETVTSVQVSRHVFASLVRSALRRRRNIWNSRPFRNFPEQMLDFSLHRRLTEGIKLSSSR